MRAEMRDGLLDPLPKWAAAALPANGCRFVGAACRPIWGPKLDGWRRFHGYRTVPRYRVPAPSRKVA